MAAQPCQLNSSQLAGSGSPLLKIHPSPPARIFCSARLNNIDPHQTQQIEQGFEICSLIRVVIMRSPLDWWQTATHGRDQSKQGERIHSFDPHGSLCLSVICHWIWFQEICKLKETVGVSSYQLENSSPELNCDPIPDCCLLHCCFIHWLPQWCPNGAQWCPIHNSMQRHTTRLHQGEKDKLRQL